MRALLLLLSLTGCGSGGDNSNNNHGYGFAYDVQGVTGMKVRGSTDATPFESDFSATETCTGMNAPAPFVILTKTGLTKNGQTVIGQYLKDPSLILLDLSMGSTMKHESVHYLLDFNTGNPDPEHTSPLFSKCGAFGF